jgi:hypothetical protein
MDCEKFAEVSGCPMEIPPGVLPVHDSNPAAESAGPSASGETAPDTLPDPAWRNEISARLHRYRARRKAPPPRYPSLRLPFDGDCSTPPATQNPAAQNEDERTQAFQPISHSALALDGNQIFPAPVEDPPASEVPPPAKRSSARIIEFPRFAWGPPPSPPDELAEPVLDAPRILEVPETPAPPPALGGITIEPVQQEEAEKRPGIDIPLHSVSLGRRIAASLIDWLVVAAASVLFGFVFWKVAAVRPPRLQLLGLAAAIPCLLWVAYQYLLIVYASTTPGLRLAGLMLARFDDSSTTRSSRRWRIFASYLSAISLGMGYAWLFLDPDSLCWHDRITRTYLAPRRLP